ncbi:NADH-quinone oxidoreductase subunit N [uncultured Desulfobulbus sp.]|uniref:NADH-quinone oxidoreductase subunit N n=1 Tax=uncultured Desulfobulbus sp. TaxID=239745 RepID=UPI0029C70324|nr:NADH-quinone oxidoreductase subunit N [uncultured Desulfobulbus sp.]
MTHHELLRHCLGILPELILALTICVVILVDMFTPLSRSRQVCGSLALLGTFWALAVLLTGFGWSAVEQGPAATGGTTPLFYGMIVRDGLASFFKLIFLLGAAATFLFSLRSVETAGYRQGEYFALLLGAVLGACFLAGSNNFIMMVLSLETLSMCSYVLAGFLKNQRHSAEAGLKYMLYGAVFSGVMLFGISYLYGMSGTVNIEGCMRALALPAVPAARAAFVLALLLVLAGLGFKMAMVPFHFWCPDVYQGSPTPVTAFLSVVSKAAGFSALLRLMLPFFTISPLAGFNFAAFSAEAHLPLLFGVLAAVTMTFGNLVALRQTDVKRLLAYSSIAHAGYILMGMSVFGRESLQAMLFYFFIYLFMNLGAFWVVIVLINRLGGAEIDRFRGARYKAPFLFWVMFIFLISLTGLPPTAGFVAKLMIFKVVIGAGITAMQGGALTATSWGYLALALIGVLNSAVSLAYYMKIARVMAFEVPTDEVPLKVELLDGVYALLFAVPTVALLYFAPVLKLLEGI